MKILASGVLAYVLSILIPNLLYPYLNILTYSDIILGIMMLIILGVLIGFGTALITRDKTLSIITSIVGGSLGLLTPYISSSMLGVTLPRFLLTLINVPLTYIITLLSPILAASISYIYLLSVKEKVTVIEREEVEEKVEKPLEKVEEVGREEAAIGIEQEAVKPSEESMIKAVEREVVAKAEVGEGEQGAEPELEFLKELIEEKREGKEVRIEEGKVEEVLLKNCSYCGGSIPVDSIYCPLCGNYLGEEKKES